MQNTSCKDEIKKEISVVVPVYNVERFLQDCIDSLIAQTFSDIEFIFVNDASTDDSLSILRRNELSYPERIRVVDSPENLRQGGARNLGIAASRGRYIGFVDSDDLVGPEMYKTLYGAITECDADVAFIQYARIPEEFALQEVKSGREYTPLITWDSLDDLDGALLTETGKLKLIATPIGGVYCGLWKRDLLVESGVRFPERLKYEDNYWMSLIRCYVSRVKFVKEVHYFYRTNPDSTTTAINDSHQFDRRKIELMLIEELKRRDLFERFHAAWEYTFITRYVVNSFFIFCDKFDVLPYYWIDRLMKDLKLQFPYWRKNEFYLRKTSKANRLKNNLMVCCPKLCARIVARR